MRKRKIRFKVETSSALSGGKLNLKSVQIIIFKKTGGTSKIILKIPLYKKNDCDSILQQKIYIYTRVNIFLRAIRLLTGSRVC